MPGDAAGPPLGVIAGRGELPAKVARAAIDGGRPVLVLALQGQAEPEYIQCFDHQWVRLGEGSKALSLLRSAGIREITFAGGVKRPSLWSLMPDARAAKFLAKVGARAMGDNSLLTAVIAEFEAEGFTVTAPNEIADGLVPSPGCLTTVEPDQQANIDIKRGKEVAAALGASDVGQSVAVQQGVVLAVEAAEGTDALIARAGQLRLQGMGGVLIKLAKPGQSNRIDLPTIGLQTIHKAADAGLRGIAISAGASIILNQDDVIAAAEACGMFIVAIDGTASPANDRTDVL